MKRILVFLCLGAGIGFFTSCVPSTPQYRIQQRPADFEKLTEKQKQLVVRGEIEKGMSRDAVALAWGSPSAQIEGLRNGERQERWDYNGRQAVTSHNFYGGHAYGDYGPYRYSGYRAGFGPEVTYLPYTKASVWFVKGRVNEWERLR